MHQCYPRLLQHPARTHRARCQHIHPLAIPSSVPPLSHSSHRTSQCFSSPLLPKKNPTALCPIWCQRGLAGAIVSLPKPLYNTAINLPPRCLLCLTQSRCQHRAVHVHSHRDLLTQPLQSTDTIQQYWMLCGSQVPTKSLCELSLLYRTALKKLTLALFSINQRVKKCRNLI